MVLRCSPRWHREDFAQAGARLYGEMVRRTCFALVCLSLAPGCFNPDDPQAETDTDPSAGSTTDDTPTSGPSSGPTTVSPGSSSGGSTTDDETGTPTSGGSTTGGAVVPDWGEGEPPDFGDLGDDGEGAVLVVHALDLADDVDVWLVGESEPAATDVSPAAAIRLQGVPREAHRVVLTRAGTQEAVACSEWFPLRAGEQWAAVAARGEHDCTTTADGDTPTFEQALALSGNTVRFVHAGTPDALTVGRNMVPEPGMLEPGGTLEGTDMPDCEASGCTVSYSVGAAGIGAPRHVTFATQEVSEVPPPGELMFVVRGDVRQDWPTEADSVRLLAVTIDADTRPLARDPEIAFVAPQTTADVSFSVPTPPSMMEVATATSCFPMQSCPLQAERFRAGSQDFWANGPAGRVNDTFELEAGERYLLVYTPAGQLQLVRDPFSREDAATSFGRVINWTDDLLTVGRVFNGAGQAFDGFTDVAAGTISDEAELPDGSWSLVYASGGGMLNAGCFSSAQTPAPWRGFVWSDGMFNLDVWPPDQVALGLICS